MLNSPHLLGFRQPHLSRRDLALVPRYDVALGIGDIIVSLCMLEQIEATTRAKGSAYEDMPQQVRRDANTRN